MPRNIGFSFGLPQPPEDYSEGGFFMQTNQTQLQRDSQWMARALALAEKGKNTAYPNPMVGAVLVKGDRVIGEGYHAAYGKAHAEIEALNSCKESVQGATLYVTLEPCCHYGKTPPCTEAIIQAGIRRVVVGMTDPNPKVAGKGIECLRLSGIEVETDVLAEACKTLNQAFLHYITHERPEVILKAAMSLDGKIATHRGDSKWITGEAARRDGHLTRTTVKGILVGIGTVLADNPRLTCHMRDHAEQTPVRIVLDKHLQLPLDSILVQSTAEAPVWVITSETMAAADKAKQLEGFGVRICPMPLQAEHFDWQVLLKALSEDGIDRLLIEGGGLVHDSALRAEIVDEVHFYIAPLLIGGKDALSAVGGIGFGTLSDAVELTQVSVGFCGQDLVYKAQVKPKDFTNTEKGELDHVHGHR